MRIHVTNDVGDVHQLDVDGQMELVNLAALIEAEMSIPTQQQAIYHNGAQLTDMTKSILGAGIRQDDILLVRGAPPAAAGHSRAAARSPQETAEVVRNQILADPHMLRQLQQSNPQLAAAAQNDPVTFRQMFIELESRRREFEERQRQQEEMLYNSDPFDAEAQKRIEEAIRQQNIAQNMENAMEYHPESFGNVVMLYIDAEVNGRPVKAFVDSGAQATIMSPALAEECNIMHLLDVRFSGIAQGVGTAKILGRIHSAQMKIGKQFLPCSFTIMEGKGVDLLFGLDMLKRHQAIIDLEKNVLRIHGEEVRFLSEHELPAKARFEAEEGKSPTETESTSQGAVHPPTALHPSIPPSGVSGQPGSQAPSASQAPAQSNAPATAGPAAGGSARHSEEKIKLLTDLGISRGEALQALDAAGGNADAAANMLFG